MMTVLFHMIFSFLSSITYGVLCNLPRKSIIPGGIVGMIGWLGFWSLYSSGTGIFLSSFVCSLLLAYVGQIAANLFKMPLTVFYIPGLVPVVPGITFYEGFRNLLLNQYIESAFVFLNVTYSVVGIASGLVIAGVLFRFTLSSILFKLQNKITSYRNKKKITYSR